MSDETDSANDRAAPRKDIGIDVFCSVRTEKGSGILRNLSLSGALLECTSIRLAVGDAIIVAFPGNLDREPGVLHGVVVRLTPDGCGIKFPGYSSADFDIVTSYEEAD